MYLQDLISRLTPGKIAMATYRGERWYVTNSVGFIRYCDLNGENIEDTIKLTPSNMLAHYVLADDMSWRD